MPNHVRNVITIRDADKETLESISDAVLNEEGFFDFQKLQRMPDIFDTFFVEESND